MVKEYTTMKMVFNFEELLHWVKNMEMEFLLFLEELKLKDFGIIIIYKEWQKFIIKTEIIMKETFICLKKQDKEYINGKEANKEIFSIEVNLKRIVLMVLPSSNSEMVKFIKARLATVKEMVKAHINMPMVINLKENGKMTTNKWGNIYLKVGSNLRADLKMDRWYLGQCFILMGKYIKASLKEGKEMELEHIQTN